MNTLLGIKPLVSTIFQTDEGILKRDFLFFDKLHIIGCKEWLERDIYAIKSIEGRGPGYLLEDFLLWFHLGFTRFFHPERLAMDKEERLTLIPAKKTLEYLLKK